MKRMRTVALAVMLVLLAGLVSPQPARADLGVSFSFFHSNLSPHGSWHVSGQYGRVWQPHVYTVGWNPYYDGHWAYTDVGWSWVSDYHWGAVPYHYGTWAFDPVFGWVWVPGYVWAPAWVVFRTGPDYIGWAPVSPHFSIGFSGSFGAPAAGSFVFVSAGDFAAPRIRHVIVPRHNATVVFNRTKVVNNLVVENNIVVNRGPDVRHIERASGRKVRRASIESVRGAAPSGRFTKSDLRIDRQRGDGRIRAAEPVSESQAVPRSRGGRSSESRERMDARERLDARERMDARQRPNGQRSRDEFTPRTRTRPESSVVEPREARPGPRREDRTPQRSVNPRQTRPSPEEAPSINRNRPSRTRPPESESLRGREQRQQEPSVRRQQQDRERSKDSTATKKKTRKQQGGQEQEKSKQERRRGGGD